MIYKIGHAFLLITVALFVSCNIQNSEEIITSDRLVSIEIDTVAVAKNISEIATDLTFIPLQTSKKCRIGKIRKVDFVKDKFIILASNANSKEVLVFNTQGNFVYKIDQLNSSGFINEDLAAFEIDHSSQKLYIYFNEQGYIGKYDIGDGKLHDKIIAPRYFSHFSILSDNILFFRDGSVSYSDEYGDYRIYEYDRNRNLQKKWLSYPINPIVNTGDIYHFKDEDSSSVLIARFACDTIFQYKNSKINALYSINAFKDQYNLRLAKSESELRSMIYNDRSRYFADKLFDTKDKLYFLYKSGRSVGLNIFDKETQRSVFIEKFKNDLNEIVIPIPDYISDQNFISIIYPHLLKQQYRFLSSTPNATSGYSRLKDLASQVSYNDNPVICLVKLKN